MIIDIHQHITYTHLPELAKLKTGGHGVFNAPTLIKDMDKWGIDKSVVLPLINPENIEYYGVGGNEEVIRKCKRYPDRLIPFCNIDPRCMLNTPKANLSVLIECFKDLGCKGIGEVCANLPVTHRLYKNLFYHAGLQKMPILFHLASKKGGVYGMIDKIHLPGLEKVLREFPNTMFIGHAPAFWAEIDGDVKQEDREGYPKREITKKGRLWFLLQQYSNLYADLSAGSALNALKRTPEIGYAFLQKFHKKLFFGTDAFFVKKEQPEILTFLKSGLKNKKITLTAYNNIMYKNFERCFGKS